MTALALNYSQNLLNGFFGVLKKTLQGMMIGWIMARQSQANYYIAQQLICEYRAAGYTVESLHHKLNVESLDRLRKELF